MHSFRRAQNRTVYFDPRLFWRYKPSRVHHEPMVNRRPVTINNHGFRGDDFEAKKPAGTYRVACLGDSTTFGWSVGDDDTFAARLEELLGARLGESRTEVLNLGVTGYTSLQGRELMTGFVKDWSPDLVVFAFGPNDRLPALSSDEQLLASGYWDVSPLRVTLRQSQLVILGEAGAKYLKQRSQGLSLDPASYLPLLKRKVSPEEYAANVSVVKKVCDEIGADLILIHVDYPSLPVDHAGAEIKKQAGIHHAAHSPAWESWDGAALHGALSAELGAGHIELRELFSKKLEAVNNGGLDPERARKIRDAWSEDVQNEPWYPWRYLMIDNGHPNRWGHEVIAEELMKIIAGQPSFQKFSNGKDSQ